MNREIQVSGERPPYHGAALVTSQRTFLPSIVSGDRAKCKKTLKFRKCSDASGFWWPATSLQSPEVKDQSKNTELPEIFTTAKSTSIESFDQILDDNDHCRRAERKFVDDDIRQVSLSSLFISFQALVKSKKVDFSLDTFSVDENKAGVRVEMSQMHQRQQRDGKDSARLRKLAIELIRSFDVANAQQRSMRNEQHPQQQQLCYQTIVTSSSLASYVEKNRRHGGNASKSCTTGVGDDDVIVSSTGIPRSNPGGKHEMVRMRYAHGSTARRGAAPPHHPDHPALSDHVRKSTTTTTSSFVGENNKKIIKLIVNLPRVMNEDCPHPGHQYPPEDEEEESVDDVKDTLDLKEVLRYNGSKNGRSSSNIEDTISVLGQPAV